MSAEIATAGFDKSPFDWYVEESWLSDELWFAERQRIGSSPGFGAVWDETRAKRGLALT